MEKKKKRTKIENTIDGIIELLSEVIIEIRELKEHECKNSGYNWYNRIVKK